MTGVTVEEFSRLVSGIYTAALDPQAWRSALADVNRAFDGTGVALMIPGAARWYNSTLPDEAGLSYRQYFHRSDRVASATECGQVGLVRTGTELMPLVRDSEFSDWLRPYDIDDALVVRLTGATRPACMIAAAPGRTEPFDTPERTSLFNGLIPHLQQALRTQTRIGELSAANNGLASALDTVGHGTVIIDANLRVIDVNTAAEAVLASDDGLCVRESGLAAINPMTDRLLQRALRDALDDDGSGARGGRTLICERPSGRTPFRIDVVPLPDPSDTTTADRLRALVLVVDPGPGDDAAALRRRYGLTDAEAEVALRIAHGSTPSQIAEHLTVSTTTVRKHLQHVFDKTDTHSQAELVRLLLSPRR